MTMARPSLKTMPNVKWMGAGALLFATGFLACIQLSLVSRQDIEQNPDNFTLLFSILGVILGLWIASSIQIRRAPRHRLIIRILVSFTSILTALSIFQLESVFRNTTELGTELIMASAFAICGAFLGWFLGKYLKDKLQSG